IWQGSKERPVAIAEVEADLESINAAFNRPAINADPWQLQGSIQKLRTKIRIREFTFSAQNLRRLGETLFSLIRCGKVRIPNDPELINELLAMEVVQTSYGWRIDHAKGGFSDRVIALGMAALAALDYAVERQRPRFRISSSSYRPSRRVR